MPLPKLIMNMQYLILPLTHFIYIIFQSHLHLQIPLFPNHTPIINQSSEPPACPSKTFFMRPSWFSPKAMGLKWTWVEDSRPFITNSEVRESNLATSDTESDLVIVTMFNLDKLNDIKPEVTWNRGMIPESLHSFIESLVQCVKRGKFRLELGDSSSGPHQNQAQAQSYNLDRARDNTMQTEVGKPLGLPSPNSFHSDLEPISTMIHEDSGWEQISDTTPHYLGGSRKRF